MVLHLHLRITRLEEIVNDDSDVALYGRRERVFAVRKLIDARTPEVKPLRELAMENRLHALRKFRDKRRRIRPVRDRVNRPAVSRDHRLHVVCVARPSLDLKRRDSRRHQLVDEPKRAEVARREDGMRFNLERRIRLVDGIAVLVLVEIDRLHDELSAARLLAFAAARALPEDVVAHEAASRLRDTLRAMHESFQLDLRLLTIPPAHLLTYGRHFGQRALPRQHHALGALRGEKLHRGGIGCRHLRRDVKLHPVLLAERDDAPVGDNEGVDIRLRRDNDPLDLLHLPLEHDGI